MQAACSYSEWWTDNIVIKLRSIERYAYEGERTLAHQFTQSYALFFVKTGDVLLEIGEERVEIDSEEIISCAPEQTIGMLEASNDFEGYIFYIDLYKEVERHCFKYSEEVQLLPSLKLQVRKDLSLNCDKLFKNWCSTDGARKRRCQIDFQSFLFDILMMHEKVNAKGYLSLEGVKQYIEENYMEEDLSIQPLASLMKLSPKYFADLFKRKYGMTVIEYVTETRLQAAKRLMKKSHLKVKEIAHQVGYADEFYFSRKFKKEIGLSPTHYMKKAQKRIVAYTSNILGHLLPLNIIPYAAPLHPKWTSYYYQKYRNEIPIHLSAYRINKNWQENVSLITSSQADLIIALDTISLEERRMLEECAEVLYLPAKTMSWKEQFVYLSKRLGELWQAEKWLHQYEQQVREVKEQIDEEQLRKAVAFIRMVDDRLYIQSNQLVDFLYSDLSLKRTCMKSIKDNEAMTLKELHMLKADCLFMLIRQDNITQLNWRKLQNEKEWKSLKAVQEEQLIPVTSDPWLENSAHAYFRKLQQVREIIGHLSR